MPSKHLHPIMDPKCPSAKYQAMGPRVYTESPTTRPRPDPRSSCSNKPKLQQSLSIQTRRVQTRQASQPGLHRSRGAFGAVFAGRDRLRTVVDVEYLSGACPVMVLIGLHRLFVYLSTFPRLTVATSRRCTEVIQGTSGYPLVLCSQREERYGRYKQVR